MKKITKNKKFLIILGFISIIAFIIRVQVSQELVKMDPQVSSPSSVTDMFTYKDLSEKILAGKFDKVFYYQPFYYAVFLPVIKFIFGNGIWPVVIIQCLISALTVWFTGLSAALIRSRKSGILTALLVAFSTVLIFYTPYYLIATLQAFWISLIFYLCVRYINKYRFVSDEQYISRCKWAGGLGLITGISILTRGNIWFFVPGIIFMFIIIEGKNVEFFKKILIILIFAVFIILPQIPFSYHNTIKKGKFTGASTAAGAVLSLGNTPESPPGGKDPGTGAGPMEYPETCKKWNADSDKTPVFMQMLKWFAREPFAFIELQFRKLLLFWDYREIPNNIALENNGLKSKILTIVGLIPVNTINTPRGDVKFISNNFIPMSSLILVFGFSGVLASLVRLFSNGYKSIFVKIRNQLSKYLLLYFILAYWFGTAVFYILSRFRVPVIPLLAVFAAIFLCQLYNFIIKRRYFRIIVHILLITCFSIFIVLFGYSFYRFGFESKIMRSVRPEGVQVRLNESKLMIKDNGPMSFGSWSVLELKEGQKIEKRFIIPEIKSKNYSVSIKIYIYIRIPGPAILNINNQEFKFRENDEGFKSLEFNLKDISDGKIVINPLSLDCSILCLIDMQRDYGRTMINNEDPGGELVCTLYIKEND